MKLDWKLTLWLSSASVMFGPLAQAQFCGLSNASLNGSYGYVASEAGTVVTPQPATGTTGTGTTGTTTPNTYSDTELGKLLGGIAAGNQFALSGVWRLDGAGDVNAAPAPGQTAVHVGTYSVNPDCSVTVSLLDPFGTTSTVTQLAGVALASGAEIDLSYLASFRSSGTSSPPTRTTTTIDAIATTVATPTTGSGLAIKLVRVLYQNGCSISNLKGLYGFVLNPSSIQPEAPATETTTVAASQPSVVIGYVEFDGLGHIVPLTSMAASSTSSSSSFSTSSSSTNLTALHYTGTYAVNVDCSGTMTVSNSSTATTISTTGSTETTGSGGMTLNFVITPAQTGTGSAFAPSPGLDLSFATADQSGSGYALTQ